MPVIALSVLLHAHHKCQRAILPREKNQPFVITRNVFLINEVAFCWQNGSILSSHAGELMQGPVCTCQALEPKKNLLSLTSLLN